MVVAMPDSPERGFHAAPQEPWEIHSDSDSDETDTEDTDVVVVRNPNHGSTEELGRSVLEFESSSQGTDCMGSGAWSSSASPLVPPQPPRGGTSPHPPPRSPLMQPQAPAPAPAGGAQPWGLDAIPVRWELIWLVVLLAWVGMGPLGRYLEQLVE